MQRQPVNNLPNGQNMKQQITSEELQKALRLKEQEVLLQVKRSRDIAALKAISKWGRIIGYGAAIPSVVVLMLKWLKPEIFTTLNLHIDSSGVVLTLILGCVALLMYIRSEYILKRLATLH